MTTLNTAAIAHNDDDWFFFKKYSCNNDFQIGFATSATTTTMTRTNTDTALYDEENKNGPRGAAMTSLGP
jgi:hypothetical protein